MDPILLPHLFLHEQASPSRKAAEGGGANANVKGSGVGGSLNMGEKKVKKVPVPEKHEEWVRNARGQFKENFRRSSWYDVKSPTFAPKKMTQKTTKKP